MDDSTGVSSNAPPRTTDERLGAIETQLTSIARWVTWLGVLSVVAVLVLVVDWVATLTT